MIIVGVAVAATRAGWGRSQFKDNGNPAPDDTVEGDDSDNLQAGIPNEINDGVATAALKEIRTQTRSKLITMVVSTSLVTFKSEQDSNQEVTNTSRRFDLMRRGMAGAAVIGTVVTVLAISAGKVAALLSGERFELSTRTFLIGIPAPAAIAAAAVAAIGLHTVQIW